MRNRAKEYKTNKDKDASNGENTYPIETRIHQEAKYKSADCVTGAKDEEDEASLRRVETMDFLEEWLERG